MTAIAWRDGILAADSGEFMGEFSFAKCQKIYRLKDGSLYAAAGRLAYIKQIQEWLDGEKPNPPEIPEKDQDDFGAIIVRPDGVYTLHHDMVLLKSEDPFLAEGAACEFMMGAMAFGASAMEAVKLAVEHHAFARGPVMVERL